MSKTSLGLDALAAKHPKFLRKGGLCVGLVITQTAKEKGLPLDAESLRTEEGGQVAGLGRAAVQKILESYGITRILAEEGGRTSRGSLGLMKDYVEALNKLDEQGILDIDEASRWWIAKVQAFFATEGPKFQFDSGKSLRINIADLLKQAEEVQANAGGTAYVGAMLQHLIGAKLDIVLGLGKISHHGFSVADHSTSRKGDFQIDLVAIHVTTSPTESLIRKCSDNLKDGLRPIIISLPRGVEGADFLLENNGDGDRIDVLDAIQFLTANVFEHSLFKTADCKVTLKRLLTRYNEIIAKCETDPSLTIRIPEV